MGSLVFQLYQLPVNTVALLLVHPAAFMCLQPVSVPGLTKPHGKPCLGHTPTHGFSTHFCI